MDIFDEAFGSFSDKRPMGPHEGVAGVLLCASACDGHIADEEVQSLMVALGRMKLYQRTTPQQFNSMMDRLMGILKRGGPEKLLEEVAPVVPPELNECVFANACNIVLADGTVEQDEREFLGNLMNKLNLDKDQCLKIIRVMVIKNRG
ncbi:MAG: tellurite resistance TerB family protein [Planctomyces sp.]|nr:tellurite resistance TerB family protein [Planctomyces sp.]